MGSLGGAMIYYQDSSGILDNSNPGSGDRYCPKLRRDYGPLVTGQGVPRACVAMFPRRWNVPTLRPGCPPLAPNGQLQIFQGGSAGRGGRGTPLKGVPAHPGSRYGQRPGPRRKEDR